MDWEWYSDSKMVHLFIHLLLKANFVDGRFHGRDVKRGQLITGRNALSKDTGISAQSIRTCLERLKSTNEITIQSTNDFSVITIVKYDIYQCFENKSTSKSTSKLTNEQPATNQQVTTIEEGKKGRKIIFQDSNIFDKVIFAKEFSEWDKEKMSYYYDSALRYSDEGNKYVKWDSAIRAWARKDELQGKINFNKPKNVVESGLL